LELSAQVRDLRRICGQLSVQSRVPETGEKVSGLNDLKLNLLQL